MKTDRGHHRNGMWNMRSRTAYTHRMILIKAFSVRYLWLWCVHLRKYLPSSRVNRRKPKNHMAKTGQFWINLFHHVHTRTQRTHTHDLWRFPRWINDLVFDLNKFIYAWNEMKWNDRNKKRPKKISQSIFMVAMNSIIFLRSFLFNILTEYTHFFLSYSRMVLMCVKWLRF